MQADPLGLVDGASVYGYVRQNPGRYVDPRGEAIPILWVVGASVATYVAELLLDAALEENCCNSYYAEERGATVGIAGLVFGHSMPYPRGPLGGWDTPAGGTSPWSKIMGPSGREFGRAMAQRWVPLAGAASVAFDSIRLLLCLSEE